MFKTLVALLAVLCMSGCSNLSAHNHNFKLYVKDDNVKNFVVTNDKHPSENYAVVVHKHEADLVFSYHF